MLTIENEELKDWSLGKIFGSDHPFFNVTPHIVMYTWIVLAVLLIIGLLFRFVLLRKDTLARHLILQVVHALINLCNQSLPNFSMNHFSFIGSLFIFIFLCNIASILPWVEEPTADINTTVALGLISFIYIQAAAIYQFGLIGYIKDYFAPFFLMFPLNVIGKLASALSISLRLFGNIYGSAIITSIYGSAIKGSIILETAGLITGLNIILALFFGLFEGFLQAFVFSMLSLTYLSIALQSDGGH